MVDDTASKWEVRMSFRRGQRRELKRSAVNAASVCERPLRASHTHTHTHTHELPSQSQSALTERQQETGRRVAAKITKKKGKRKKKKKMTTIVRRFQNKHQKRHFYRPTSRPCRSASPPSRGAGGSSASVPVELGVCGESSLCRTTRAVFMA